MIKQKNNKGFIAALVLGVLFMLVSAFMLVMLTTATPESLVASKSIYSKTNNVGKKGTSVAVTITQLVEKLPADNTDFYLVLTDDTKMVLVETAKNDERFTKAEKDANFVLKKPLLLAGKQEKFSDEDKRAVRELYNGASGMDYTTFVSIVDYDNDRLIYTGASAVGVIMGVVIVFIAFKRRRTTVKNFATLYATYPELENNLNLIAEQGYYNEKLKIGVYKNTLLAMTSGLDVLDLSETLWMDFAISHGYKSKKMFLLRYILDTTDTKRKMKQLQLRSFSKKLLPETDEVLANVVALFPHILTDYEDVAMVLGNEVVNVSIDSIVAEQKNKELEAAEQENNSEEV